MNRKNRKKLIFAGFLNIAAIAAVVFLFYTVTVKEENIGRLKREIELASIQEQMADSIKKIDAETLFLRQKFAGYTVDSDAAVNFIELIEDLGRQTGALIEIVSVEPVDSLKKNSLEILNVKANIEGEWNKIIRTLGLLELIGYESEIAQAIISKTDPNKPWKINLTIEALKKK